MKSKALPDNQVKFQQIMSECYGITVTALTERCTEFHTYKLKEERSYGVVLKIMHYSINPDDIKIEKLGHMVTNTGNIERNRTKLPLSMFFVDLKPAQNNKDIFNVEYIQQ
jgi:hypothetical protein